MGGAGFAPLSAGSFDHVLVIPKKLSVGRTVRDRLVFASTWDMGATSGSMNFYVARNGVTNSSAWSTFAGIYDSFKVNGIRVRMFFPQEGAMIPGVTKIGANTLAQYPGLVAATYDNDAQPPSTISAMVRYDATQYLTPTGECSLSLPVLPLASMQGSTTSAASVVTSSEWCDIATPVGVLGGINFVQDKVATTGASTAGTLLAVSVVIEYDVTFRERI
jgi:hypothetical protein